MKPTNNTSTSTFHDCRHRYIPYPWTVSQICRQDIAWNHACELFCRTSNKQFLQSRCSGQGSVNVPWFQSWFFLMYPAIRMVSLFPGSDQNVVSVLWLWSGLSMYSGSKQRVSVYFGSDQNHVNELWFQSGVSRWVGCLCTLIQSRLESTYFGSDQDASIYFCSIRRVSVHFGDGQDGVSVLWY